MADSQPLVRYPIRTPAWVYATLLAILAGTGWFGVRLGPYALLVLVIPPDPWLVLVVLAIVGLSLVGLYGARPYLVPRGTIDLYADRMEIPGWWGGPIVLPYAGMQTEQVQVVQQVTMAAIPMTELDRGHFRTYRSGRARRKLSDRVFTDPNAGACLHLDVELARAGQAPHGPEAWAGILGAFQLGEELLRAPRPESAEERHYRALDEATRPED